MATIYQKTVTDKTCILSPREYILRPFDFDLWTEMRIGFYFSLVAASDDNTNSSTESVTLSTASDRVAIGLKDSATSDLPGFGTSLFLGAVTYSPSADIELGGNAEIHTSGAALAGAGYHDTTLVGGTVTETLTTFPRCPATISGSSSYCGFYAVKFVISNRGASSQSVAISTTSTASVSGTDYSADALRLLINNATYSTPATVAWNTGAAARDIPDAFYCRLPFYSNRIRLSAIRCIRYAP